MLYTTPFITDSRHEISQFLTFSDGIYDLNNTIFCIELLPKTEPKPNWITINWLVTKLVYNPLLKYKVETRNQGRRR